MPSDQDEVPAGAVIAAMELVKGLGDDQDAMPGDELLSLIRDASVTPAELAQGFALLIHSFMHLLDGPMDLVPAVIRKLRALELVSEEVLPTMAGAPTAAALGQSPLRWRQGLGSSTPAAEHAEGPAWAYTAWLLADFLDFAADENGATAKLTDSLFAKLLEEDDDEEGRSLSTSAGSASSQLGSHLPGRSLMFVRSFSTSSRPACGRPPPAAALGRQHRDRNPRHRRHAVQSWWEGLIRAAIP